MTLDPGKIIARTDAILRESGSALRSSQIISAVQAITEAINDASLPANPIVVTPDEKDNEIAALKVKIAQLTVALKESTEVLRSAHEISLRKGENTNWSTFQARCINNIVYNRKEFGV